MHEVIILGFYIRPKSAVLRNRQDKLRNRIAHNIAQVCILWAFGVKLRM